MQLYRRSIALSVMVMAGAALSLCAEHHSGALLDSPDISFDAFDTRGSCVEHAYSVTSMCTDGRDTYLLKQTTGADFDDEMQLVIDYVVSNLGLKVGVPVNPVFLVGWGCGEHLKPFSYRIATLHGMVPGTSCENSFPAWLPETFCLEQQCPDMRCPRTLHLTHSECGLTRQCIESLAYHEDLARIAALDTFFANRDRGFDHIFYDSVHDRFYGIDHDDAFLYHNMVRYALQHLDELRQEGYFDTCGRDVRHALCVYRATLENLYDAAHPDRVEALFAQQRSKIRGCDGAPVDDAAWHNYLQKIMEVFRKNYADTAQLIQFLYELV